MCICKYDGKVSIQAFLAARAGAAAGAAINVLAVLTQNMIMFLCIAFLYHGFQRHNVSLKRALKLLIKVYKVKCTNRRALSGYKTQSHILFVVLNFH